MSRSDEHSSDLENDALAGQSLNHKRSHDNMDKEDAATQAASEDLKHTTISDKDPINEIEGRAALETEHSVDEKGGERTLKASTPEPFEPSDAQDAEMKEQISSPKKKRSREQDDDSRESDATDKVQEVGTPANGTATAGGRTTRLAPEKKRHRDTSADPSGETETLANVKEAPKPESTESPPKPASKLDAPDKASESQAKHTFGSTSSDETQKSSSAFANSAFGALSSSISPFASLAGNSSVFGAGTTTTGFGALASKSLSPEPPAMASGFGGNLLGASTGFGDLSKTSGFGATSGGFGAPLGGTGFAFGAPKLSSFAAPSGSPEIVGAEKPAKAFGAPESDEEEETEDGESDGGVGSDDEEKVSVAEDKKKIKISKVPIESGEEGEATLLQFRAKIYTLSKDKGWKERGVGTVKLNVPKSYVEYDDNGVPIPGTFDPSGGDEDDEENGRHTVSRLIMRQENTHRVILNTPIVKGLKFEEKPSSASIQILFTAFEDGSPIQMLLKMNESNARLFTSEIDAIQREL